MITRTGDHWLVSGNVTMATVNALFREGMKLLADSNPSSDMVIDFAKLEKVDSSAVSLMLVCLREARRIKANLRFINVPDNLMSLAKLYGVAELMQLSTSA